MPPRGATPGPGPTADHAPPCPGSRGRRTTSGVDTQGRIRKARRPGRCACGDLYPSRRPLQAAGSGQRAPCEIGRPPCPPYRRSLPDGCGIQARRRMRDVGRGLDGWIMLLMRPCLHEGGRGWGLIGRIRAAFGRAPDRRARDADCPTRRPSLHASSRRIPYDTTVGGRAAARAPITASGAGLQQSRRPAGWRRSIKLASLSASRSEAGSPRHGGVAAAECGVTVPAVTSWRARSRRRSHPGELGHGGGHILASSRRISRRISSTLVSDSSRCHRSSCQESARECEGERGRETERERGVVCVCVFVQACVCACKVRVCACACVRCLLHHRRRRRCELSAFSPGTGSLSQCELSASRPSEPLLHPRLQHPRIPPPPRRVPPAPAHPMILSSSRGRPGRGGGACYCLEVDRVTVWLCLPSRQSNCLALST